jgi:hypothetical protein
MCQETWSRFRDSLTLNIRPWTRKRFPTIKFRTNQISASKLSYTTSWILKLCCQNSTFLDWIKGMHTLSFSYRRWITYKAPSSSNWWGLVAETKVLYKEAPGNRHLWSGWVKGKTNTPQTIITADNGSIWDKPTYYSRHKAWFTYYSRSLNCISILSVEGGGILFVYNMEIAQL